MTQPYLDCTNEVSQFRLPPDHRRAWVASEIIDDDWIVNLNKNSQKEIAELANFIQQNPVQNFQRRIENYSLPHLRQTLQAMKTMLQNGVGFCVLNKLPMDDYPIDVMVETYWLLGQLIGRPVAQKWNGEMVYDVRDSGIPHHNKIRGSHTNTELVFHTDNAFAKMPPEYVGLLCRYPAKQGGISRFCSLYTVHNRMHQQYPSELQRLYEPMFFNRQTEHHPDAPKVSLAPYFCWNEDRLNARANSSLVRAGYEVAEEVMDAQLSDALDAIDEICFSEDIWFEGPLQRGYMQYLNNKEVGHYRSEFIDHKIPEKKRHLFRLWHRERGSIAYDGYEMS